MGAYQEAVRMLLESELVCANCAAENIGRKKYVELDAHGRAACNACGHMWTVKSCEREDR